MHLAALKEEKTAGRVRYIGVQVIADPVYPQLESVMRNEPIDFIGVDYDVGNRARVEDTILPLALERKIGVMAFFPFGIVCARSDHRIEPRRLSRRLIDSRTPFAPLTEHKQNVDAPGVACRGFRNHSA